MDVAMLDVALADRVTSHEDAGMRVLAEPSYGTLIVSKAHTIH